MLCSHGSEKMQLEFDGKVNVHPDIICIMYYINV